MMIFVGFLYGTLFGIAITLGMIILIGLRVNFTFDVKNTKEV
jgi:hypothetical protein